MLKRGGNLSIRAKVALIICASILTLTSLVYVVSNYVFLTSYLNIESQEGLRNIQRADDALHNAVDQLAIKLADWAWWDDTYVFVTDGNEAYIESNLQAQSLVNLKQNAMVFVNASGEIVAARMVDDETGEELSPENLVNYIKENSELWDYSEEETLAGLVGLPEGMMYLASSHVLTSNGEGPSHGRLFFGKFLDEGEIQRLEALTHLEIDIFPNEGSVLPEDFEQAKDTLVLHEDQHEGGSENYLVTPLNDETVAGYHTLLDIKGDPIAFLRMTFPRHTYIQGKSTFDLFTILMGLSVLFFGVLIMLLLERYIIYRLTKLNEEVEEIRRTGELSYRIKPSSMDEIGKLSDSINNMLAQIASSQLDLEKFKLAVENADEHVIITDAEGRVLYANKSAEKITGYKLKEMLGKTPALWGGQMSEEFYKKLWKTISIDKKTFAGEVTNKRKNGESYLAASSITPILDKKKNVIFYVGIEQDITKRRQAEIEREEYAAALKEAKDNIEAEVIKKTKELREEKARFLASVNSLHLGFAIVGMEGEVVIQNPALAGILDVKTVEKLDEISTLLKTKKSLLGQLKECAIDRCTIEIKEIVFGKKYLRLFMTPVFASENDGETLGGVLLLEDITVEKEIDKAKSEFVSLASHQLRTPLSTINWYIELLLNGDAGKMTKSQKEYMEEIGTGSRRMAVLVNALLQVSRLEVGNVKWETSKVVVSKMLDELMKDFEIKYAAKKLEVTVECSPDLSFVTDERYAEMVIENLISNAHKYTPANGKISITAGRAAKDKKFGGRVMTEDVVTFSVQDTGYGIPLAQQSHVFDKLFRADNVLDKEEGGSGLGLYIARLIMDRMKGQLWFASEEGKGTTFYVAFPEELKPIKK